MTDSRVLKGCITNVDEGKCKSVIEISVSFEIWI